MVSLGLIEVPLSCVGLGGSVWASPQSGGVYGGERSSDGRGREVDSTHVQPAQTGLPRAATPSLRRRSGLCDMHLIGKKKKDIRHFTLNKLVIIIIIIF